MAELKLVPGYDTTSEEPNEDVFNIIIEIDTIDKPFIYALKEITDFMLENIEDMKCYGLPVMAYDDEIIRAMFCNEEAEDSLSMLSQLGGVKVCTFQGLKDLAAKEGEKCE